MASVTLQKAWFHDANDNSDNLALFLDREVDRTGKRGDVRTYAGGRQRAIVRAGVHTVLELTFEQVSRTDLADLLGRVGKVQLYRDPRGRKLWGVFFEPQIDEIAAIDLVNVTLTFTEVSFDEAV